MAQNHRQTDRRTCQLLDQLGPEGRVGEKITHWPKILTQENSNCLKNYWAKMHLFNKLSLEHLSDT